MGSEERCEACGEIGAYVEIANAQEPAADEPSQSFPPAAERLAAPNPRLEDHYRYASERLLKCPACGAYYWYSRWAPGGSDDVLHSTIHESLRRLSDSEAREALEAARREADRWAAERGWVATAAETRLGVEEELRALGKRDRPG